MNEARIKSEAQKYLKKVSPSIISQVEVENKNYMTKGYPAKVLGYVFLGIAFLLFFIFCFSFNSVLLIFAAIVLAIGLLCVLVELKSVNKSVMFKGCHEIARVVLNNGSFSYKHCDIKYFKEVPFFSNGDVFKSEGELQGTYRGINVRLQDLSVTRLIHNSNNTTDTEIVFDGVVARVSPLNKKIDSQILVIENRFSNAIFSIMKQENKCEMEDENFNKTYDVFSTSQHDCFYILTPQVIQKLQELANYFQGKIDIRITSNEILFCVNGMFLKVTEFEYEDVTTYFIKRIEKILSLLDIINVFNLTDKFYVEETQEG